METDENVFGTGVLKCCISLYIGGKSCVHPTLARVGKRAGVTRNPYPHIKFTDYRATHQVDNTLL